MQILAELSIFPTDKGESVSAFVTKAVKIIQKSGLPHQLGPMGTSIEGDWDRVMTVIKQCMETLAKESNRVYMTMKVDYRKGAVNRLEGKVNSIKSRLKII